MKVCIPVLSDQGLDSRVSGHFGSAPVYLLVDDATGASRAVENGRRVHDHGACRPLDAIAGEEIDVVVVGGIGPGALEKLTGAGIRVVRAGAPTARGCLAELARGEAVEIRPADACASHGGGHAHGGAVERPPALGLPSAPSRTTH